MKLSHLASRRITLKNLLCFSDRMMIFPSLPIRISLWEIINQHPPNFVLKCFIRRSIKIHKVLQRTGSGKKIPIVVEVLSCGRDLSPIRQEYRSGVWISTKIGIYQILQVIRNRVTQRDAKLDNDRSFVWGYLSRSRESLRFQLFCGTN
jgi:hypothetical protein